MSFSGISSAFNPLLFLIIGLFLAFIPETSSCQIQKFLIYSQIGKWIVTFLAFFILSPFVLPDNFSLFETDTNFGTKFNWSFYRTFWATLLYSLILILFYILFNRQTLTQTTIVVFFLIASWLCEKLKDFYRPNSYKYNVLLKSKNENDEDFTFKVGNKEYGIDNIYVSPDSSGNLYAYKIELPETLDSLKIYTPKELSLYIAKPLKSFSIYDNIDFEKYLPELTAQVDTDRVECTLDLLSALFMVVALVFILVFFLYYISVQKRQFKEKDIEWSWSKALFGNSECTFTNDKLLEKIERAEREIGRTELQVDKITTLIQQAEDKFTGDRDDPGSESKIDTAVQEIIDTFEILQDPDSVARRELYEPKDAPQDIRNLEQFKDPNNFALLDGKIKTDNGANIDICKGSALEGEGGTTFKAGGTINEEQYINCCTRNPRRRGCTNKKIPIGRNTKKAKDWLIQKRKKTDTQAELILEKAKNLYKGDALIPNKPSDDDMLKSIDTDTWSNRVLVNDEWKNAWDSKVSQKLSAEAAARGGRGREETTERARKAVKKAVREKQAERARKAVKGKQAKYTEMTGYKRKGKKGRRNRR